MRHTLISIVALVTAAVALGGTNATAAPPVQVDWHKSFDHVDAGGHPVFLGTTSGGVTGQLTSVGTVDFASPPNSDPRILHVTFVWTVCEGVGCSGSHSFTASTSGIWNLNTGHVVMNGRVIDGWLNGAQVHEEGQLLDPATLTFEGFLRLLPDTAA